MSLCTNRMFLTPPTQLDARSIRLSPNRTVASKLEPIVFKSAIAAAVEIMTPFSPGYGHYRSNSNRRRTYGFKFPLALTKQSFNPGKIGQEEALNRRSNRCWSSTLLEEHY